MVKRRSVGQLQEISASCDLLDVDEVVREASRTFAGPGAGVEEILVTGHPAMTVPCAPSGGFPVGVSSSARSGTRRRSSRPPTLLRRPGLTRSGLSAA